jgi:agmatinase
MIYVRNSFPYHNFPLEDADVIVVGIPFDSTSINPGSIHAPAAIRESLKYIEGFDPDTCVDVFEKLRISDIGDIEVVPGSYELTAERITETIKSIKEINSEAFLLFLGGEHLISLPIIKALKPETVLDFDAHADLRRDYLGNRFSHATWASHLLGGFDLVQRGVRSFSKEEKSTMEKLGEKIHGKTYLTIDLDVFDPSIAPETGLPEPDGWMFSEFCSNLGGVRNLVAADLVEFTPKGFNSQTGFLAANVIKKILSLL